MFGANILLFADWRPVADYDVRTNNISLANIDSSWKDSKCITLGQIHDLSVWYIILSESD